jgi:hypothetical protein
MITPVRLFNPYVTSIVGEKLFQKELDELSNVIKDNRAKLGSMREKTDHTKSSADNEERDEPTLSLSACKQRGARADRYHCLRQKTRRDHRQPAGLRTSTLPIEIMN